MEREREIFNLSVVTGIHCGTKTPPFQPPTDPCERYDKKEPYLLDTSQVWSLGRSAGFGI